ncbi:hypothetical protein H8E50_10090 [bacterium]|nr:hypothetical protein [bacterium]
MQVLPAANIWANNGWEWRFDDNAVFISLDEVRAAEDRRYEFLEKGCRIGSMENCDKNADLQILTFGNSHELDAYNILVSQYGQRDDINITSFGTSFGCGFKLEGGRVINTKQNSKLQCSLRAGLLNDKDFINTLDIIAYSVHQPLAVQDTMTILRHLKTINPRMKIIFFSGYIGIRPYRCDALINRYGDVDTCKDPKFVNYFAGGDEKKMILAMTFAKTDFLYIDKVDLFCEGRLLENCLMQANRTPAFYDGDHLSVEFARLLSDKMTAAYADELAKFGL